MAVMPRPLRSRFRECELNNSSPIFIASLGLTVALQLTDATYGIDMDICQHASTLREEHQSH